MCNIEPSCPWMKEQGVTLDGKAPCCLCHCEPTPCEFMVKWPKERPPVGIGSRPKKAPRERPGCFYAERGKNFLSRTYPCFYCPPDCCTRPCCKHWKSKEVCCKYDDPCIAHHFTHPFGPSCRYPPDVFKKYLPPRCCRK